MISIFIQKTKFVSILFILSSALYAQSKTIEIEVKNEPWTTGDICTNLGNKKIYDGDIYAGNEWFMPWVDMRGWAEFDLPTNLENKKIKKIKIKFNVLDASHADDHSVPGSHNLVITEFPFDVRVNSPWDISDYFDELKFNDAEKIYGVDWEAGESSGIKEVNLKEKAIEDVYSCIRNNKKFIVGFWEFNDNASKCTISGKGTEYAPRLIFEIN